jgi:hypothetical protein
MIDEKCFSKGLFHQRWFLAVLQVQQMAKGRQQTH